MKHLFSKEHHPHLKKRAILEIIGLIVLVGISINQREVINTALNTIRRSDLLYLLLLAAMYWILVPLTPISYRLISKRKIPLTTTILAQLAGAGPGRIIPGGLGHLSISSIHLNKVGIKLQKAIVITVSNNVIGLIVNLIMVTAAIALHPTLLETIWDNISTEAILALLLIAIFMSSLFLWLSHFRNTRKTIRKVNKEWGSLFKHLIKNPHRLFAVLTIAGLITLGHSTMLILAGNAVGSYITLTDAIIALSAGVLVGGTIPTPGGLGAVEAGTISALILLGYDATQATSVVLLYRTATYFQPLIPGIASYYYLRERKLL